MVSPSLALVTKLVALLILPCSIRADFSPTRISWDKLRSSNADNSDHELLDTLRDVGLVSLVNIPNLNVIKHETLTALAACIQDDPQVAATHVFDDGTVRRTLATHSLPNAVPKLSFRGGDAVPPSCRHLQDVSTTFRQLVQEVTQAFAARLQGLVLDDDSSTTTSEPLLLTRGAKETAYLGLTHAVQHGEHLEHFHAYEHLVAEQQHQQQPESSSSPDDDSDNNMGMPTVDWHLDQGLFLVFTPGLQEGKPSDGFYVQLPDGSQEMVQFEAQDDLIILLGDALHQILNPKLTEPLRIPPHALTVPQGQRVWYGRMVLPPADALVPSMDDLTFGELRHQLIAASVDENNNPSSLGGCSSPILQARHLETVDCDPDTQFFCWHRCFNLTADLTPETCQTQNLTLECINDQRQLWNGDHDMAFKPGCIDADNAEVAPKKTVAPTDAPTGSPVTSSSVSFSTMMVSLIWGTVAAAVVLFA